MWWLFREVRPLEYLAVVYGADVPFLLRLPAAGVCLGALWSLLARRWLKGTAPADIARPLAVTLAGTFVLLALSLGTGFLKNALSAATGVAIVAAATGMGLRLCGLPPLALARERFNGVLERLVLAAALGLGALALAAFVLGSVGVLSPWFWWTAMAAAGVWSWRPLKALVADAGVETRGFSAAAPPMSLAVLAFLAAWCVLHVPLLWAPPVEYDVLEYHLGAVAQYLRDGQVSFLHENLYATMPQNGEMLYLLGMVLAGGKWPGLPAAHTVLFAAWVLSICGVYALVGRVANPPQAGDGRDSRTAEAERASQAARVAAGLAALLYALIPLGAQLTADFYVEHVQALFHLAALLAACAFWAERRAGIRDRFGWLVLAGLLAGCGCGAKYSALLLTLLPLLVLIPLFCAVSGSCYEALRAAACIGISALAVLAPWLVRNCMASGDPLHPLGLVMRRRLWGGGAVPDRLDHFEVAVRSGGRSWGDFGRALAQLWPGCSSRTGNDDRLTTVFFWLRDNECGPHLLCFALPGFLSRLRGEALLVAGFVILDLACWFLFTHRLNRFWYPQLGPLAVLAGLGMARLWRLPALRELVAAVCVAAVLVLAPLPLLYVWMLSRPAYMAGVEEPREAAGRQFQALGNANWFAAWEAVNALPPGSQALCLGDAQTFYLDATPAYSVVFNQSLLEEVLGATNDAATAARLLSARGVTHIYINYAEWFRLDTSYALTRAPGTDSQSPDSRRLVSVPARWRFARLEPARRELLRTLLCRGQMEAYGGAWPPGVWPAYLKLRPGGYAALEQLLAEYTVVERAWRNEAGWPSCELRRLAPSVEP